MVKKEKNKRLVLLDAHAILHRAFHALPEFSSSKGEPTGALYGLSAMLIKILSDLEPDYVVACYDLPGKTYRHEAFEQYKAQRKKTADELSVQIDRSRDVFKAFAIPIYEKAGFEADDILGTIVEELKTRKDIDVVIASGDMDTLQLIDGKKVRVYTLKKGISDTVLYDEEAVKTRFGFGPELIPDYKGLRGDASDNIPGVAGIGEKTATVLITHFGSIESLYKTLKGNKKKFDEVGIKPRMVELLEKNEEEALFSKMLATIRRDADISFSLPENTWKESIDIKAIDALFSELEFRTLGARVRETFMNEVGAVIAETEQKVLEEIPEKELHETAIALWVLNSNFTNPEAEQIIQYAKAPTFKKARETIFQEIEKRHLSFVFKEIEQPLIPIIETMEKRGIKVDTDFLKKLSEEYTAVLKRLEKEIWTHAGEEFNINSPKQLGAVLFDKLALTGLRMKKTAGGARSTRESELMKLADAHPIIKPILEHRELQKLLSTYIDTIPFLLDAENRLHTTLLQAGTTTGRMSSNNPNLQNIPIKTELGRRIRNAFVTEQGWKLIAFDYSQIELRIAAFLSGDEKMITIFKNGEDVHTSVAAQVFKVAPEKVDYEMRRRAKVINFGIIYGMGVNALRENLGCERKEAQEFYNKYFENFATLAKYLEATRSVAARQGYTETFFGRRRYFEGINSKIPFIKAAAERMAINAPIQGTEADLVKLAMIKIDEYMKAHGLQGNVYPLLQVHDEIIYEAKDAYVAKLIPDFKHIMETIIPLSDIKGVPILAEASIGESWGSLKKVK